jgi:hypothetical protein
MSKLRDILDDLVTKEHNHAVKGDTTDFVLRDIAAAEQQIKDIFNELVGETGEDEDMEELWARGDEMDITSELHSEGINMFKVELRKKLEDL